LGQSNKQLKNRAFLYIITIGIIMFFVFLALSYFNYQEKMQKQFQNKTTELKMLITSEEKRIVNLYKSRLYKNLKSYGVIEAIKNNNQQELYSLIKPRYEELLKENTFFKTMHFHTSDNRSFLRMHKPQKFGDDLENFRQIVVDTNNQKKFFYGFEEGVYGYFYRIIIPVMENETHLGSVEFGLDLEYFIENLRRLTPNTNYGLLFDNNKKQENLEYIKEYALIVDYNKFFNNIKENIDLEKEYQIVSVDDKTFIVSSDIYIKDYKGNDAIKILFAIDVTDFKNTLLFEVIALLLVGLITYIISIFIINSVFQKYISSIEDQTKKLKEHSKIIDEYVIVSITDTKGLITHASAAFCEISGYSKEELLGKPHSIIRHPDMDSKIFKELWSSIKAGKVWVGEMKNKKKDGDFYWVQAYISPTYNLHGKITGYTAIRTDITDKKVIEKISQTDKLTQVYNRLKLDETLLIELERSNRYHTPLAIISLDIDKFKSVNDTYGHHIGDRVLVEVASVLQNHLRKTDTLGRWGGEEFLIICSQTDVNGAGVLAEALREAIDQFEFNTVKHKTASFGVTQYIIGEPLSSCLQRCNKALYESKDNGRNRVTIL